MTALGVFLAAALGLAAGLQVVGSGFQVLAGAVVVVGVRLAAPLIGFRVAGGLDVNVFGILGVCQGSNGHIFKIAGTIFLLMAVALSAVPAGTFFSITATGGLRVYKYLTTAISAQVSGKKAVWSLDEHRVIEIVDTTMVVVITPTVDATYNYTI